jgi:FkbM family methyltransferase
MSALSFRIYNRRSPIVSVEPNPFHESDLRFFGRLARPFSYRMWAAGRERGELVLHVPVYRGVPLTPEASLVRELVLQSPSLRERLGSRMDSRDFTIATCEVPVRPLDCLDLSPAFIKLDVQGFEHEALLGLTQTLRRTHPVLLIETPDQDVRSLLDELGYEPFSYSAREHRLVPEVENSLNTVFIVPS